MRKCKVRGSGLALALGLSQPTGAGVTQALYLWGIFPVIPTGAPGGGTGASARDATVGA
jgi:hypothetical protein